MTEQHPEASVERREAMDEMPLSVITLLDAVASAVLVLDPDGRVLHLNRAGEEACGLRGRDVRGRRVSELASFPPVEPRGLQIFEACWSGVQGRDQKVTWTCRPTLDESGRLQLIVCTGAQQRPEGPDRRELVAQVDFLQTLIDRIPNPVFFKGADGRYLGGNVAFGRFLGVPLDQIVGRTVYEVAPPELADRYHRRDQELFDHPGLQIYEAQVKGDHGELRDVIFYKATYPSEGSVAGLVGVILDITERRQAERALQRAHEELEQRVRDRTSDLQRLKEYAEAADRAKSEFLNIASHELRTPLTTLLLAVQRVRMAVGRGRPVTDAMLDGMDRNIRRLAHLAGDLLDVARLERGDMHVARERIDLREPVGRAVEAFRLISAERTFDLNMPQTPVMADADADRIEQVVSSLLDNAVKYTPRGPVKISLRCDENERAVITVSDEGPGIPPEQQPQLFRPYSRRDSASYQAGMGLGLYLSREILLRHGGDIRALCGDEGTTLVVHLPACGLDSAPPG